MADHHEDTCREPSYSFDEGSMTKGPSGWEFSSPRDQSGRGAL